MRWILISLPCLFEENPADVGFFSSLSSGEWVRLPPAKRHHVRLTTRRSIGECMASSLQGKQDSHLRIVSSEDAVVFPENATPTDDCPTVISKSKPTDGSI